MDSTAKERVLDMKEDGFIMNYGPGAQVDTENGRETNRSSFVLDKAYRWLFASLPSISSEKANGSCCHQYQVRKQTVHVAINIK